MSVGIQNITNITFQNITDISNVTSPTEFWINVDALIYGGYLYFILLIVGWIILFGIAQLKENQPLHNLMYSGAVITVISFFLRTIQAQVQGNYYAMLTDFQMWVVPIITALIASWVHMTRND